MERHDLGDISQILLVVETVQIFPLSTACVERGFSLLKMLKTDYKTHMDEETLNALMRINLIQPESFYNLFSLSGVRSDPKFLNWCCLLIKC